MVFNEELEYECRRLHYSIKKHVSREFRPSKETLLFSYHGNGE